MMNDKWGYIDKQGNPVSSFEYDYLGYVHKGLAVVENDHKWGIIQFSTTY
jgi:hypothetical protein